MWILKPTTEAEPRAEPLRDWPTDAMPGTPPDLTFKLTTDSSHGGNGEEAQTFRFSSMTYAERSSTADADRDSTVSGSDNVAAVGAVGRGTFSRGSLIDRNIEAIAVTKTKGERARDYKGRYRVSPVPLYQRRNELSTDLWILHPSAGRECCCCWCCS